MTWFTRLPDSLKALSVAGGVLLSIATSAYAYGVQRTAEDVPARLSNVETANARQDTAISGLQTQAPRTEYLFCVDLSDRGLISKTPQDCYEDYTYGGAP